MDLKIRRDEGEVLRARPSDKIQNGKGFKCRMPIVRPLQPEQEAS